MRLKPTLNSLFVACIALAPSAAFAHPGHDHVSGFMQGISHPLTGVDHILAMVMVGIFAVQIGGRATWALPATFIAAMALGSVSGMAGIAPSIIETGIGISVVLLGALIAMQLRMPILVAMAMTGIIALFHGYAHGAEAQGGVSTPYLAGFLISTAILHAGGIIAATLLSAQLRKRSQTALRVAGGTAAAAGLFLIAG